MKFSDLKPMIFEWNNANVFPTKCTSKLEKAIYMTRKALAFYGLMDWSVGLDKAKKRAGCCYYREKAVYLSMHFVELNSFEEIEATIKHEIAHAISFVYFKETGHGRTWKAIAIAIGDDGERCYDSTKVTMPKGKYILECPKCKREITYHKKSKTLKACGICCRKYNYGKFTKEFIFVEKVKPNN